MHNRSHKKGPPAKQELVLERRIERRIGSREFMQRLSIKHAWFERMVKLGRLPRGYKDPGGKRNWWPESLVDQVVRGEWQSDEEAAA